MIKVLIAEDQTLLLGALAASLFWTAFYGNRRFIAQDGRL